MVHRSRLFYGLMTILFSLQASAEVGPYCLALRGNGDSEPAHWGAIANIVEHAGLPQAQAGGSSAALSLFILEGVASNPWVNEVTGDAQASRAALLVKSLYGITLYIGDRPQVKGSLSLLKTYADIKAFANSPSWSLMGDIMVATNPYALYRRTREITKLVKDLMAIGIGSSRYSGMLYDLTHFHQLNKRRFQELKFYVADVKAAVAAFGGFNAEGDKTLLFRDGLVDFEKLGAGAGRVATFLAGEGWDQKTKNAFQAFASLCEPMHKDLTWNELVTREPRCQSLLNETLSAFYAQELDWNKINVVSRPVGYRIPTFPTTSVLMNDGYTSALNTYNEYHQNLDRTAVERFNVANPADLRFGYWGSEEMLARIQKNLSAPFMDGRGRLYDFSRDAKSQRFLSLGPATWSVALKYSPAEPGLAPLLPMSVNGQPAFSAGGWSDLHPIPVLKAAGCNQVIYATRRGGESLFGQGIGKRLMNLERDWSVLRTSDPQILERNNVLNDNGDANDLTSRWSSLYNVANPNSSYMTAVASADAILCTDWNRFDVKKDLAELVRESYQSPYVVNASRADLRSELLVRGAKLVEDATSISRGRPDWAGCFVMVPKK